MNGFHLSKFPSVGVLLWSLRTRQIPWAGMPKQEVIQEYVLNMVD